MARKALEYKDFDLIKFKFADNKVEMDYFDKDMPNKGQMIKSKDIPHQKLQDALQALNEAFAYCIGSLKPWNEIREKARKHSDILSWAMSEYDMEVLRHKVSGVIFLGDGLGIQITGSRNVEMGAYGLAGTKLYFEADEHKEIIDKVKPLLEVFKQAVWRYAFKNEMQAPKLEFDENDGFDDDDDDNDGVKQLIIPEVAPKPEEEVAATVAAAKK